MPASLKVTLIAKSMPTGGFFELTGGTAFGERILSEYTSPKGSGDIVEFAGRNCYQSWEMPNPATATNEGYIGNIISQDHTSVLEHASFSFHIEGVSRSLTHELVRHRHLSFSQLSQRYVDQAALDYVVPPALRGTEYENNLDIMWQMAVQTYENLVYALMRDGLKRKEARQAARAVLPEMTETKITVTGNAQAWRHFIKKRNHPAADAEIRQLAEVILSELVYTAPTLFQDLEEV